MTKLDKLRKLTLDRETVAPLTPSDLGHVHGGYRGDDGGCIPTMHTRMTCSPHGATRLFCIPPEAQPLQ